jgi:hypothetical protein
MGLSVLLAAEAAEAAEAVQAAEAVEAAEAAGRDQYYYMPLDQASLLGLGPQKWLRLERAKPPAGETEETSPRSLLA